MYNKLLIAAGGGIISRDQQAEQNEGATIAIGLGGTGVSCLRALKKEVYNRLKPDKTDSAVPEYQHIKFLAIDTDKSSLADNGSIDSLDSNTEFLDLSCADISALLAGAAVLKNKRSLQWLKASSTQPNGKGIEIQSAEAGAGGVRQIGRLLLFQNSTLFVQKLTNLIREAKKGLKGTAEINIHIFTGIGGGTGAGTFLDVCYLTQYVLDNLGLQGIAQTCGYFFMPDVNIDCIADTKIQEYVKSNGFASMQELDYCMNFAMNGGEWNQVYDGFEYRTTNRPVKLAHLITATSAEGRLEKNAFNYAMHVAVDYVMEFLTKPYISSDSEEIKEKVTIKGHISNIESIMHMVSKEHGACYRYCVLGAANAYLPYKDITTYLTSKIFAGFGALDKQLPSDNDIDLFVHNVGLKYEDISRDLNNGVSVIKNYPVDTRTIYEQTEGLTADTIPQVLVQMRDETSKVSGKLVENKKSMLQELEQTKVESGQTVVSMIARVNNKLKEIASQPDKGPYYAGAILHNINSRDLQNKIDGYIERNDRDISKAIADMSLREQTMANALRELQNSNALNRNKRGQNYVNSVNQYFKQSSKIEALRVLNDVLVAFKKQIIDLFDRNYGIFDTVMQNLEQTFAANLSALSQPVKEDNGYAVKLMSIEDLKDSLDNAVAEMKIDDMIRGFVTYMLDNPDIWIAQDENKISYAVSSYFLDKLKHYTGKTIVDYLQIKYGKIAPEMLSKKVYDEILLPLAGKAAPLIWIDGAKYQIEHAGSLGYCSVPEISAEIKAAAASYHASDESVDIRISYNTDRISFLLFKCGVPMYGYKGVDNYRKAKAVIGAHLYEGAVGDDRDWRKLYDITPYSCIDTPSDTLLERTEKIENAEEMGVLASEEVGNSVDYKINIYNEEKIIEVVNNISQVIESGDIAKAEALKKAVSAEAIPEVSQRAIMNMGSEGYEKIALKDNIIASEVLMNILDKELQKVSKYNDALKALEEFINNGATKANDVKNFARALCTGVIVKENDFTYAYVKEGFGGLKENINLTEIDTKPYGEDLPLYSAYVGFGNLDTDIKKEVEDAIRDKRVNHGNEIAAIKETVEGLITSDKVQAMAARAQASYRNEFGEIVKFLNDFAFEVSNF